MFDSNASRSSTCINVIYIMWVLSIHFCVLSSHSLNSHTMGKLLPWKLELKWKYMPAKCWILKTIGLLGFTFMIFSLSHKMDLYTQQNTCASLFWMACLIFQCMLTLENIVSIIGCLSLPSLLTRLVSLVLEADL